MILPPTSKNANDPHARDAIEDVAFRADDEGAYMRLGRELGFSPDQLAQGAAVRAWHPWYRDGLSSFIYHYRELFDASGRIIAKTEDFEDIREG